jgi:hypothetical protein
MKSVLPVVPSGSSPGFPVRFSFLSWHVSVGRIEAKSNQPASGECAGCEVSKWSVGELRLRSDRTLHIFRYSQYERCVCSESSRDP